MIFVMFTSEINPRKVDIELNKNNNGIKRISFLKQRGHL